MTRCRDPLGTALIRAIRARAGPVPIEQLGRRPWASATFAGAVSLFAADLPDTASARALAAALEDHEFSISRHVVADVATRRVASDADGIRLEIEILTVED